MARRSSRWPGIDLKRGDIYLVSLEPTIGHEQQGHRPVLVISPDSFNVYTQTPVVVPITSGGAFARKAGFTVSLTSAGTSTVGVIRCDQPRVLDLAERNARRLESVPDHILQQVLAKVTALFK